MGLFNDVSSGLEGLVRRGNVGGLFLNVAHGLSDSAAKVTTKREVSCSRFLIKICTQYTLNAFFERSIKNFFECFAKYFQPFRVFTSSLPGHCQMVCGQPAQIQNLWKVVRQ